MRIRLSDLAPGVNYALQVRALDQTRVSDWSRVFDLLTTGDTVAPKVPASVVGSMTGTSFNLSWAQVIESSDNSPAMDLDHYEILVASAGTGATKVYSTADTKFQFTFEMNRELFGTPRANIIMSVLARDKTGNPSAYSGTVSQTNAAPANVTGLSGTAGVDTVTLKWTANTDADLLSYEVHRSKTGSGGTYTKVWEGVATTYADQSIDYFTDHWYRVYAKDVFGTLSTTPAQTGAALRPTGSFVVDSTAPATPAGLAITLTNATDGKTAKAAVTWTAVTDTDGDLSEYIVDYKPSAETAWETSKVDYEKTALTLTNLLPYTNYDFRIRSSDWSANLSAWSTTVVKTATANTAPATVTGVAVVPGKDSLTISWTPNTEPDVSNGNGTYSVDIATNSGFSTGLLNYKTGAESIAITGLAQGQIYYVRVKAVDSLGLASAAFSTSVNATTGTLNNFVYTTGPSAPSSPSQGDIWMDTTSGFEKQRVGAAWVNTGNASIAYVTSKGTDLITNGTGLMASNYNFSQTTFITDDAPAGAGGAFRTQANATTRGSDEFIPVDPNKPYKMSVMLKQTGADAAAKMYMGLWPHDINQLAMTPPMYMFQNNTTTTLAVDLVPGATTITLTSAANWNNAAGASAHFRTVTFWNYTDRNGKVWEPKSYTRELLADAYADGGISGNVITLRVPWVGFVDAANPNARGGTIPAGTPVSNGSAGASYMYMPSVSNLVVPQTWTNYTATYAGAMPYGAGITGQTSAATTLMPPGCAYVKVMWIPNRDGVTAAYRPTSSHAFANVSMSDAGAAYDLATASANGKNKIIHSTSAASGTTGYIAGDTWFRYNGSDQIIGQWRYSGSAWISETIENAVIANLDAGKMTANSAFITTLNIGSGGVIQSAGYTGGGTSGFQLSNTGLTIKGTNNVVAVEAVAAGTISAKTINIGVGGVLNVDSTGVIKSNNYSGTTTGYQLSNTGLVINDGDIDAKNLRTNSAVIGELIIGRSADAAGTVRSFDYVANTTGWKIGKNLFEINDGLIKAKAIQLQTGHNMMPIEYADFEYGDFYYITSFWNARGQGKLAVTGGLANANLTGVASTNAVTGKQWAGFSSVGSNNAMTAWLGTTTTDYNINVEADKKYILSAYLKNYSTGTSDWNMVVKGDNAAIISTTPLAFGGGVSQTTWTRVQAVVTIPSSGVTKVLIGFTNTDTTKPKDLHIDAVQFEPVVAGLEVASAWKPPASTTIDGSGVTTGYLRSVANINVSGVDLPSWSLNKAGSLQVGDALIRGKLVVGTTTEAPVNRAPGNGDFESNATGYQVYQIGATGTNIVRSTVSPIEGTGSLSVTAAAGAKTRLGASWTSPIVYQPGTRITISAKVKVNTTDAGSTIRIALFDAGLTTMAYDDAISNPVAGTVYNLLYEYIVDEAQTVSVIAITHAGTALTTTQTMIDSISVTDDVFVGNSYVTSPDYSRGQAGWRIQSDGTVEFNNGIFRGALGANMVTGDTLSGNIVLASTFLAGVEDARRVEFSDRGIQLWEADGSMLIDFPTDPTRSSSITGDLIATSMTISDQLAIRGSNNELARGASLTIAAGTTNPNSPPTVSVGFEMISRTPDTTWDPYKYGFAWDNVWNGGGGCFLTVQNIYGGNASIDRLDKTTGLGIPWSAIALSRIRVAYGGITVLGGVAYVLGQDINGAWYIEGRDLATKAKTLDVPYVNGTSKYIPTIGNDGTNLMVAYMKTADRKPSFQFVNPTTGAGVGSIVNCDTAFGSGKNELSFIGKGAYDFGTTRVVMARRGWNNVYVFDTAGAKLSAPTVQEDWVAGGNITGMAWAATDANPPVFWAWDAVGGKIIRQSNYRWAGNAANDSTFWVWNTWYDSSTAPAVLFNVTNKALTSNVATLTTSAPHGMTTGNVVIVTGVDATFNGTYTLTGFTTSTISYAKTAANVTSVASGGQVGVQSTTHETMVGPEKPFTMAKRQSVTVTVPPIPITVAPTGDDVNAAIVYMAKGTAKPTNVANIARQAILPNNNRVGYFSHSQGIAINVPAAGAAASTVGATAAPGTNGFIGVVGAAAAIKSSNNQFSVDGLGVGNWGGISVNTAGNVTIHGSDMTDTGWLTSAGFTATANCTLTSYWVRRIGKLCFGYFNVNMTNALAAGNFGNITLINVPVGWRTSTQNGVMGGGTAAMGVDGAVTTANGIIISSGNDAVAAGGPLSLSVTWFID